MYKDINSNQFAFRKNEEKKGNMKKIEFPAFALAQRFVGIKEVPGSTSNPQILDMLPLYMEWPKGD